MKTVTVIVKVEVFANDKYCEDERSVCKFLLNARPYSKCILYENELKLRWYHLKSKDCKKALKEANK